MPDEIVQSPTLRDTLAENFEAAEAGLLETPPADRPRDEAGRFAKSDDKPVAKAAEAAAPRGAPLAQTEPPVAAAAAPAPALQRPTTWKRDYLPIWDKLAAGTALTPDEAKKLAEYTNQREVEYKTGVSTYKTEAMQAKEVQDAITPYLPELEANGLRPSDWIKQMGQAHYTLVRGTPEQKLQMFQTLARQYGVPVAALNQIPQQGGIPPLLGQLLQNIDDLRNQVQGVNSWRQQTETQRQQEMATQLQGEVEKFAANVEKYPHFEKLREPMAQLLETGAARDLDAAYRLAERADDELFNEAITRRMEEQKSDAAKRAQEAKAKAISPKTSTPRGLVGDGDKPKDRRAQLAEQFDAMDGGRV